MKVLEAAMKATQMPQLGGLGQTAMKAESPTFALSYHSVKEKVMVNNQSQEDFKDRK
jgi:hypothetical protein